MAQTSVSTASEVSDYRRGGQQQQAALVIALAKDKIPGMSTAGDMNIMAPRHPQTTPQHSLKSRSLSTMAGSAGSNGLHGPHFIKDPKLRNFESIISNKAAATTMTTSSQSQVPSSHLAPKAAHSDNMSIKLRRVRRRASAAEAAGLVGEQGLRAPTTPTLPLPAVLNDASSSSSSGSRRSADSREVGVGGAGGLKPTVRRRRSYVSASDFKLPPSHKVAAGVKERSGGQLFPNIRARSSFTAHTDNNGDSQEVALPIRARSSFNELESSRSSAGIASRRQNSSFTSAVAKQNRNTRASSTSDGSSGSENGGTVWPRRKSERVSFAAAEPSIGPRVASKTVDGSIASSAETVTGLPPKKMPPRRSVTTGRFEDGMETDSPQSQAPWGGIQDPRETALQLEDMLDRLFDRDHDKMGYYERESRRMDILEEEERLKKEAEEREIRRQEEEDNKARLALEAKRKDRQEELTKRSVKALGMIGAVSKMSVKLKNMKKAAQERLKNIEHCDPAVQAELEARKNDIESEKKLEAVFFSFATHGKWSPLDVVLSDNSDVKGMTVKAFLGLCHAANLDKSVRTSPKIIREIFGRHCDFGTGRLDFEQFVSALLELGDVNGWRDGERLLKAVRCLNIEGHMYMT